MYYNGEIATEIAITLSEVEAVGLSVVSGEGEREGGVGSAPPVTFSLPSSPPSPSPSSLFTADTLVSSSTWLSTLLGVVSC